MDIPEISASHASTYRGLMIPSCCLLSVVKTVYQIDFFMAVNGRKKTGTCESAGSVSHFHPAHGLPLNRESVNVICEEDENFLNAGPIPDQLSGKRLPISQKP